jgi:hypothetical protein
VKLRVLALALDGTIPRGPVGRRRCQRTARSAPRGHHDRARLRTASLEHHVARGDFSRWARDVLGDADLAAGLAKLETTSATGAPVDREELRRHLHERYVL